MKQAPPEHGALRHAIVGWILFVVCALFFMASGWRDKDILTFVGSIIFLVACLVFLIPLLCTRRRTTEDPK